GAFGGCGLTNISLGSGLTSMRTSALFCENLLAISVDPLNPVFSSIDGVLFDKGHTTILQYPQGRFGSYALPSSVAIIPDRAFVFCVGLTAVTIPNTVLSIGRDAFGGCTLLTNVIIPNSVTSIGDSAFLGCTNLATIVLGNGLTDIP